jgi:YD repeat-containing protein
MKKICLLLFVIALSLQSFAQQTGDTVISANPQNLKLKVYYFHITNRCHTCINIETNVKKTLIDNFLNQLELGIIDLYVVNCELPENKELAQKYDAYGSTLAITSYERGKESKTEDLTNWAFGKAYNEKLFIVELKSKIEDLIK